MVPNPLCTLCQSKVETIERTLLLCPWIQQVWPHPKLKLSVSKQRIIRIEAWLMKFTKKRNGLPSLEMVVTTPWHIWKSRNNLIFRGQNPNAEETVEATQVMEENYEKWGIHMAKIGNEREGATSPTSIAPERGRLKINVDGSLVEGSTDGAIACICRDHIGVLVDGLTKSVKASSVAQVETLVVLEQ